MKTLGGSIPAALGTFVGGLGGHQNDGGGEHSNRDPNMEHASSTVAEALDIRMSRKPALWPHFFVL